MRAQIGDQADTSSEYARRVTKQCPQTREM